MTAGATTPACSTWTPARIRESALPHFAAGLADAPRAAFASRERLEQANETSAAKLDLFTLGDLMRWVECLFPSEPRTLPGRRWLKIGLRAVHVVFAWRLPGFVRVRRRSWRASAVDRRRGRFRPRATAPRPARSAAVLLQVRGLVVLLKVVVLISLPWLGSAQLGAVIAVVVVSVLSSHAPGKVRYYLVAGRDRIRGGDSMG